MALKLKDKINIVEEVTKYSSTALSVLAADYRGLTVEEMTDLRKAARATGQIRMRVIPNTLARRALKDTEFACLSDSLVGPLFLAFSYDDPAAAARLVKEKSKKLEKLKVKAIAINGKVYGSAALETIASLPTRDQALSMLLSVLMAAPTKLARTLIEPCAQLARATAAVRDKA